MFRDAIDLSWRIRALRVLGVPDGDADIVETTEALIAVQQGEGGWSLSGVDGPLSVTATCSTVLALLDSPRDEAVASVRKGISCLASVMDRARPPKEAFAAAQIACVASRPAVRELGGKRMEMVHSIACDEVMAYLARRRYEVEEEELRRGGIVDTWRHLTLPLSLRAVGLTRPKALFHPVFRDGLIALLDLQETAEPSVNCGGFRTSPEGFVTSYATTQSLEVLSAVRESFDNRVNPAVAFDMICSRQSRHHTDPQTVPLTVLAASTQSVAGTTVSRVLFVTGSIIAGLGVSAYVTIRLHQVPNMRVLVVAFTLFTALVLPIVTFVLS